MRKSRMFYLNKRKPIKRWNPGRGCTHRCYGGRCWASLFSKRLKFDFSKPELIESRLNQRFGNTVVFVWSLGDMFCSGVPDEWIRRVIEAMKLSPRATFFLETKNPVRYLHFPELFELGNVILSTTIETNRDYRVSLAPSVRERYDAMMGIRRKWMFSNPRIHISIEPILDFDLDVLVGWMRRIEPWMVSVGYDNYNAKLPEPPLEKTLALIERLEQFTRVERKTGVGWE